MSLPGAYQIGQKSSILHEYIPKIAQLLKFSKVVNRKTSVSHKVKPGTTKVGEHVRKVISLGVACIYTVHGTDCTAKMKW